jgi:hypothetical protein
MASVLEDVVSRMRSGEKRQHKTLRRDRDGRRHRVWSLRMVYIFVVSVLFLVFVCLGGEGIARDQ